MDSSKEQKRTVLPFDKPVPIAKDTKELLLNTYGKIRAEIDHGVAIIQTKKMAFLSASGANRGTLPRASSEVWKVSLHFKQLSSSIRWKGKL